MDILEEIVLPYVLLNNMDLAVVKHVTVQTPHVIMFMDAILRKVISLYCKNPSKHIQKLCDLLNRVILKYHLQIHSLNL